MKLHHSPGACSLGIHVILEEIGAPFELVRVDFSKREQYGEGYLALNPKSKVPALVRDDGSVLTEYPAIAVWLGMNAPDAKLLARDADGVARTLEAVDFVVSTVHMLGFTRLFRPERFAPHVEDHDWVKQAGRETIARGFDVLARSLEGRDWLVGGYSIADATLFYCAFWAHKRLALPCPPAIGAHYARMLARPAVRRALAAEGLSA